MIPSERTELQKNRGLASMSAQETKQKLLPPVVDTSTALREEISRARSSGRTIAFVPTMGALHAGHISLIEAAENSGAYVVVSIYVNPTQFSPHEDLAAYPRTIDADRAACRDAGVDLIFTPDDAEMYPPGDQTRVHPGPLAETMCGLFRPGHFEGVSTVVTKLFNLVQPDVAYFGQKDAQQALIIRRMVKDLCIPVRIEVCPIVREPDGLAMSSRNAYLSTEQRSRALCLYRALCEGRDMLLHRGTGGSGDQGIQHVVYAMQNTVAKVASPEPEPVTIDYMTVVDAETLEPATKPIGRVMLAGAVRIGETRLIDNLLIDLPADRR